MTVDLCLYENVPDVLTLFTLQKSNTKNTIIIKSIYKFVEIIDPPVCQPHLGTVTFVEKRPCNVPKVWYTRVF